MAERFAGRTVVVTGASRGLGRAIARAFASEGAYVYVGFRASAAKASDLAHSLPAASALGFDVRDAAAVRTAFDRVLDERGRIDVLVNNAAVADDAAFALMDRAAFDDVVATNLAGTFACCRAAIHPMLAAGRGAIVNVASVAGLRASPGQASYAASKGAVLAFTATLAAECAPRGVRVNAVVPGLLATGMGERLDARRVDERIARIPARRAGTADEVAAAVLFLASDDASYVVGQALVVDGGLSL